MPMSDETKHFVAYHNVERMGRSLSARPRLMTNKPVARLHEGVVWMIVGEGRNPRRFSLGSVFRVTEEGSAGEEGFKYFAAGNGSVLDPLIPLNDLEWFTDFKKAMNSFQFGIQPLTDEEPITALIDVASANGVRLP
jgi:hypothetical protein